MENTADKAEETSATMPLTRFRGSIDSFHSAGIALTSEAEGRCSSASQLLQLSPRLHSDSRQCARLGM